MVFRDQSCDLITNPREESENLSVNERLCRIPESKMTSPHEDDAISAHGWRSIVIPR
jgi:hypothetical protein